MQHISNQIGGSLQASLLPAGRGAYCTNARAGGGTSLFLNEFVNPYPEKEIKNLTIQLPNPEQRDFTFAFHDAIFAVTGVEACDWDLKFWQRWKGRQEEFPLLPANAPLDGLTSILKNSELSVRESRMTWSIKGEKEPLAELNNVERSALPTWRIKLKSPQSISAMSFRLAMPHLHAKPMPVRFKHADCHISVSVDQKTWTEVAVVPGCTGMDGEHRVAFSPVSAAWVQIVLDSSKYTDEDASYIGPLAVDLFTRAGQ